MGADALTGARRGIDHKAAMKIDRLIIEKIRDAANVADVIGDFYELRRKGADRQCLCPFHNDRHLGSFVVSERRNTYTCFACGAHGDSIEFLMRHERMTFFEAVAWLGKKYGIDVEGGDRYAPKPARPRQHAERLPMLELDFGMVSARLNTEADTLCNWIRGLAWNEEQRGRVEKVLQGYGVGHAQRGNGYTIFWQIDELGHVRTGKMMLYKPDGHRDKDTPYNFTWAHTLLAKTGRIDPDKTDLHTTLFGMHLLNFHPDATVNIVESEKTALLAGIMWGHPEKWVWMASGGLSMLSASKLKPLIDQGRQVRLYPDRDGVTAWKQQAMSIGYKHLSVDTQYIDRYWRGSDGEKADIGDIIVGSLDERRAEATAAITLPLPAYKSKKEMAAEAMGDLCERNPWVAVLRDKLKLEPINIIQHATD